MPTDASLTEGDMDLARTKGANLDPPRVPRYCEGHKVYQGLSLCLTGGAWGGKGGWDGTGTSLIVI